MTNYVNECGDSERYITSMTASVHINYNYVYTFKKKQTKEIGK